MLGNIMAIVPVFVFVAGMVFLFWYITRKRISIGDLTDAEWELVYQNLKDDVFYANFVARYLRLSYKRRVDPWDREPIVEIEVLSKKALGTIGVEIKGDRILRAYADKNNYSPLSSLWAHDLNNQLENIIRAHLRRRAKTGVPAS